MFISLSYAHSGHTEMTRCYFRKSSERGYFYYGKFRGRKSVLRQILQSTNALLNIQDPGKLHAVIWTRSPPHKMFVDILNQLTAQVATLTHKKIEHKITCSVCQYIKQLPEFSNTLKSRNVL